MVIVRTFKHDCEVDFYAISGLKMFKVNLIGKFFVHIDMPKTY